MTYPSSVKIVEVGARDGLQNEKQIIATEDKFLFIQKLLEAGIKNLEATSFVRVPKIPQMADAKELFSKILPLQNTDRHFSCLVPNVKGLNDALACGVQEIALFTATSNTFNLKNINADIDESFKRMSEIFERIRGHNIRVRAYISTVFGCPYEGDSSSETLKRVLSRFEEFDIYEYSLGDTIGVATPKKVETVLKAALEVIPLNKLAMHFHDTRGMALANILRSLELGVHIFDSSAGGLGGCPYAKGASGNVATEEVINLMNSLGIDTGIDFVKVIEASEFILKKMNKSSPSKFHQAYLTSGRAF